MAVVELGFRAMASACQVVVVNGDAHIARAAARKTDELEQRWSRFLPTSDISRLNRSEGQPVAVGPETIILVNAMVDAWVLTGGAFDPTVLPTLIANGYASSIDDPSRRSEIPRDAKVGGSLDEIEIDLVRSAVTLPVGMTLDPGGLGKGLAADLVGADLLAAGAAGALVSIGGDLSIYGRPPEGGWLVVVESPGDPTHDLCTLDVGGGGVATSSAVSRRWSHEGVARHHLIDPRTGRQATTDLQAVTVLAANGWRAEAIATESMLAGSGDVGAVFAAHQVEGIAVTASGGLISNIDTLDGRIPMLER